jgi:hypothetical protein
LLPNFPYFVEKEACYRTLVRIECEHGIRGPIRAAAAVGPRTSSPVRRYLVTLFTVPVGATLVVIMFAATTLIIATKGKLGRAKEAVDFMPVSVTQTHDWRAKIVDQGC